MHFFLEERILLAHFDWNFVAEIFPSLLKGAVLTIELTLVAITVGTFIGLVASLMRVSGIKALKWLSASYIDFFRGTPLLVQIMIIHYALPQVFGYKPNAYISGFVALSINSGAYVAEIFRAGIQSIDPGQMEAARSLGMTYPQAMLYIVLPQAFKVSIPPIGNEFIALLKDSSLVAMISLPELMTQAKWIVGRRPKTMETYLSAAFIYLIMTMTISQLVAYTERRLKTNDRS